MTYRKVGGLHHWRVGRLGGSFYIAKRAPTTWESAADYIDRRIREREVLGHSLTICGAIWFYVLTTI